jgi:subtilase family serine protease
VIDLTIAAVDLQVNGRPYAQLMPGDLQAGAPVQFQLVVKNLGGRGADPFSVKLYVMGRVEASYSVDMGLAGFGEALVLLEWSKPAAGLATLRITADSDLAVEDERNRADNSFSLSLDIAAAPSGNGDSSGDGDGFSIPGFGLAGALLSAAIVARRRW